MVVIWSVILCVTFRPITWWQLLPNKLAPRNFIFSHMLLNTCYKMNFKGNFKASKKCCEGDNGSVGHLKQVVVENKDGIIINWVNRSPANYRTSFDWISFVLLFQLGTQNLIWIPQSLFLAANYYQHVSNGTSWTIEILISTYFKVTSKDIISIFINGTKNFCNKLCWKSNRLW